MRQARSKLKGTGYFVNEQFPKEIADRRKELLPKCARPYGMVKEPGSAMTLCILMAVPFVPNLTRNPRRLESVFFLGTLTVRLQINLKIRTS